jgi:hypothetical protein
MILCSQLILTNVQNAVFFIAFQRAFASIRRKMMHNILMQVEPDESNCQLTSVTLFQDMGFFEERDSANILGRLTNQVPVFPAEYSLICRN